MIVGLDYASQDMVRRALIARNDSGEAPQWDVDLLDHVQTVAIYAVRTLARAQQIARAWCDKGTKA